MPRQRVSPAEIEARIVAALADAPGPLSAWELWTVAFGLDLTDEGMRPVLARLVEQGRVRTQRATVPRSWVSQRGNTITRHFETTVYSLALTKGSPD